MKRYFIFGGVGLLVLAIAGIVISQNFGSIRERLTGYEEVPAVSSEGNGTFSARISKDESSIDWELTYGDTESTVTQSHIHFGQKGVNGSIVLFLCTNLGNGPAGTQSCPASGTISGTFTPENVVGSASAQGIAAGEFAEVLRAMRAGVTYVNIHTTGRPGGEIRSQIDLNERRHH